jgi:hypothetical protein
LVFIDDAVGQTIDADYPNRDKKLSLKFGIRIIDEIIEDIIVAGDATLFRVFSVLRGMSRGSARELGKLLKRVEGLLRKDGLAHDATMVFGDVALTFILANDPMLARERFERLRQKRAHENQYAQEYMLVLSPPHLKRHDRFDRNSHHFKIRAVAMRQNSVSDARILAFSPRIPEKDWAVKDEGHGRD